MFYMKIWKIVLLLFLVGAWAFLEKEAGYYGASWLTPELPHNLEPEHFNGLFLFKYADLDGDFAVGPFYKINEKNDIIKAQAIYGYPRDDDIGHYVHIQRYTFKEDLYAEYATWNQQSFKVKTDAKKYYFKINGHRLENSSAQAVQVLERSEFERSIGNQISNLQWISVNRESLWHVIVLYVLRVLLLATVVYQFFKYFLKGK